MLFCASCLRVHLHLCICTPSVPASILVVCHIMFMEVYLPQHTLCAPTNMFTMVRIWGSCWTACAILFSGFPPPSPEPQIVSHPYDIWNVTGQDVIFGCEVFAYPMASIEWRKDGLEIQLPGDDPHISVQVGAGSRASPGQPRACLGDPTDSSSGSSLGVDPKGLR